MIKKADIILFVFIVVVGLGVSWWSLSTSSAGDKVVITVNGEIYGTYNIDTDREIDVTQNGHTNHITIKDGSVSMTYSDCKNQICVNTKPISQTSDTIVCLPNKVVVEIVSENGGDVDVISG